jgi:hypothetical protein
MRHGDSAVFDTLNGVAVVNLEVFGSVREFADGGAHDRDSGLVVQFQMNGTGGQSKEVEELSDINSLATATS